jgi:hypothetical protein
MVRGVYIRRATADRLTIATALDRYLKEVTPTKRPSSQEGERRRAAILKRKLGQYSLAALTPEIMPASVTSVWPGWTGETKRENQFRVQTILFDLTCPAWTPLHNSDQRMANWTRMESCPEYSPTGSRSWAK